MAAEPRIGNRGGDEPRPALAGGMDAVHRQPCRSSGRARGGLDGGCSRARGPRRCSSARATASSAVGRSGSPDLIRWAATSADTSQHSEVRRLWVRAASSAAALLLLGARPAGVEDHGLPAPGAGAPPRPSSSAYNARACSPGRRGPRGRRPAPVSSGFSPASSLRSRSLLRMTWPSSSAMRPARVDFPVRATRQTSTSRTAPAPRCRRVIRSGACACAALACVRVALLGAQAAHLGPDEGAVGQVVVHQRGGAGSLEYSRYQPIRRAVSSGAPSRSRSIARKAMSSMRSTCQRKRSSNSCKAVQDPRTVGQAEDVVGQQVAAPSTIRPSATRWLNSGSRPARNSSALRARWPSRWAGSSGRPPKRCDLVKVGGPAGLQRLAAAHGGDLGVEVVDLPRRGVRSWKVATSRAILAHLVLDDHRRIAPARSRRSAGIRRISTTGSPGDPSAVGIAPTPR